MTRPGVTAIALGALLASIVGCTAPGDAPSATLQHVVLLELRDAGDVDALRADCDRLLPSIPGVVGYVAGEPVDIGRDGVIGDYSLGLVVALADVEAYREYLVHPDHLELLATWGEALAGVRVIDFGGMTETDR